MARCARTLRVPGRTSELARVRRCVAVWAADADLPEATARRLQMAVDEAVANAIEHGLADPERGRITVEATEEPTGLTVAVRHRGARFDPTSAPIPSPSDAVRQRAAHGYGLHLIRTLVDAVAYGYRAGRDGAGTNEVRLTARR